MSLSSSKAAERGQGDKHDEEQVGDHRVLVGFLKALQEGGRILLPLGAGDRYVHDDLCGHVDYLVLLDDWNEGAAYVCGKVR
eukprot:CAMPEP_0182477860 /NCGR_PEP_ID=MMETSP1319-20130603/31562_1 /TAXON_ID=172717 /ORGANISM="Bolidomonas pacifica, Strain RCC208" /LENGTH=81 /DNA_ID=CAMNT_0024679141 /DNA_START=735 /DNA_END=975 /DNA_ORIENTATION=-